jgi:carbamoyl-phosphate synthase large subunit
VIEIADDKFRTFEFFRKHGFDAPESCLPGGEDELLDRIGFPLIVKPRTGARSIGVQKVSDRQGLKRAILETRDPVIQECVGDDSQEYTAGTLCFGGECRAAIVMRRDLRDGNTYRAYVDQNPELAQTVRRFAEALGAHGPANFQFRIGRGKVKVFEINARFSGTTPLRMHAGFNEVEMCVRHLVQGSELSQPSLRNVTILRHWSETVIDDSVAAPLSS